MIETPKPVSLQEAIRNGIRESKLDHAATEGSIIIIEDHVKHFLADEFTSAAFDIRRVESLLNTIKKRYILPAGEGKKK